MYFYTISPPQKGVSCFNSRQSTATLQATTADTPASPECCNLLAGRFSQLDSSRDRRRRQDAQPRCCTGEKSCIFTRFLLILTQAHAATPRAVCSSDADHSLGVSGISSTCTIRFPFVVVLCSPIHEM